MWGPQPVWQGERALAAVDCALGRVALELPGAAGALPSAGSSLSQQLPSWRGPTAWTWESSLDSVSSARPRPSSIHSPVMDPASDTRSLT